MKSLRKRSARLLAAMVLLGTLLVGIIATTLFLKQPRFATITSPDGTLSLHLKGDPTRPHQPLIDHSVDFDLFRNNQPVLVNKFLHWGDWFDASFYGSYRGHNWVTNSVIRFWRENAGTTKCDTLIVLNHTKKPISYLYIQSSDLFLVFDPDSRSELKLCASPQASITSLSWIAVEGEFADGKPIPWKGSNFMIDRSGPFEYHISITSEGPRIFSYQLQEYRSAD